MGWLGRLSFIRYLACVVVLFLCAGCYHMRVEPVPLGSLQFEVPYPLPKLHKVVKRALVQDGFFFEEAKEEQRVILTRYRYFYKAVGFGQPDGGRDYYYRLRVILRAVGDRVVVLLEPIDLEMRSFYVFDQNQNLQTMGKRYSYEDYPGMFDLPPLEKELQRVKMLIDASLGKVQENIRRYGTDGL